MNLSLIVCPVDFSSSGEAALRRALTLAQWHEAELHVVHVRPGRARRSALTASTDASFGQLLEFISSLNPRGVAVTPVVLRGDPITAVAECARGKSADLVVVGQNAGHGNLFWRSGVLATNIARAVASPTLTVSQEAVPGADVTPTFNNIVCAIDFSAASLRALNKALTLAQQSGGRITLLHVLEGFPYETVYSGSRAFRLIGEYRARVERVRRELLALVPPEALNWCEVHTEVVSGIPHDAIRETATARKADLVVIGHPRSARLDRIVMASTVSGVLRRARFPVLTVPGPSIASYRASTALGAHRHDDEGIASLTLGAATHRLGSSKSRQKIEVL